MNRTTRLAVFLVAGGALAALLLLGVFGLPHFGGSTHPYRDHAVAAAVSHATANVVSSVNFDQRGLDTLGEETILLASVLGVAALLRQSSDESARRVPSGQVLEATKLFGYVFLPVTLVLGLDVIAHGHVTPGGGFQGGVVLGTGIHLLYVAGTYKALERVRPIPVFEWVEALGAGTFASFGIAATLLVAGFLANVLPYGSFGSLLSSGSVEMLNGAVGIEVAAGVVVLLGKFLEQAITIEGGGEGNGAEDGEDAGDEAKAAA